MDTYTTINGDVLDLRGITDAERAFLDRLTALYRAGKLSWGKFSNLVMGPDNPTLDQGRVTQATWDNPMYQAARDLEHRVGLRSGSLNPRGLSPDLLVRNPFDDAWLTVTEAAIEKRVTVQGIHKAIGRGALVARPRLAGGTQLVVSSRSLERWQPSRSRQTASLQSRRRL